MLPRAFRSSRSLPLALLLLLSLHGASSRAGLAAAGAAATPSEVRALWVVRDSLVSPASVRQVVDHAVQHGFNTLMVQVRGRGDSYFAGGLEPRAPLLDPQPPTFDPLATILDAAHRAGIAVHAWVSVNLVASVNMLPASHDHVVNRHPEWLMVPRVLAQELANASPSNPAYVGRLARWTRTHPEDIEGLFLSPIVPGAAGYTVGVIEDLVRRYALDGVHLDYIRYPGPDFDFSRGALEEFASVMARQVAPADRSALDARARDDVLAWVDAYPDEWNDFRRSRLTALLMKLRTAVQRARPQLPISAAVFPDARDAFATRLQDWRLWAESGLVDVVCPMAYTTDTAVFRRQIDEAVRLAVPAQVWAGIGAFRLTPAQTVTHIDSARLLGARGIVLFSYDSMTAAETSGESYLGAVSRAAFSEAGSATSQQRP